MIRLGRAADVPMLEGRSVAVGGRRLAVFRTADGFHAIDHACPHAGGPLADGIVAGGCVACPLHGLRFELATGRCADGASHVRAYAVEERGGELWLAEDLADAA